MEKLKNNIKELFIFALILLAMAGYCIFRYNLYKKRQEELSKYKENLTPEAIAEINSTESTLWPRIKGTAGNAVNIDGIKKSVSLKDKSKNSTNDKDDNNFRNGNDGDTNTLIHFDVSSEYNSFIFDDTLLMFLGDQSGATVKGVLNRMIETASDDFYSNPKLTIKNFGNIGTIEDNENYISNIESVKNSIVDSDTYNVSFGYNKTRTTANEVIIEKK